MLAIAQQQMANYQPMNSLPVPLWCLCVCLVAVRHRRRQPQPAAALRPPPLPTQGGAVHVVVHGAPSPGASPRQGRPRVGHTSGFGEGQRWGLHSEALGRPPPWCAGYRVDYISVHHSSEPLKAWSPFLDGLVTEQKSTELVHQALCGTCFACGKCISVSLAARFLNPFPRREIPAFRVPGYRLGCNFGHVAPVRPSVWLVARVYGCVFFFFYLQPARQRPQNPRVAPHAKT